MAENKTARSWDRKLREIGDRTALVRWLRMQKLPWQTIAFWVSVTAAVAVRLWQLDRLQAEAFGDITTAWLYVEDVLSGKWPFYIPLSTGPLFHYLFAGVTVFSGLSYFGLKLASVFVSLAALVFTYLVARRLLGSLFATLATFIAGISFWFLIHSRLGNVPIGVPLLAMLMVWLMLRFLQQRNERDLYWAAVVSCLGLYTYAAAYILPAILAATLVALHFTGIRLRIAVWLRLAAVFVVMSLPFAWIVSHNTAAFGSAGYLGAKFQLTAAGMLQLARNALNAFAAYNLNGDIISRVNPLHQPHLDLVSGLLFLLGIWFWLGKPRRREGLILLVPLVLLHVPSMLVVSNNQEVPSSTRTVGAALLAYIFVASGLWQLAAWLRPRVGKIASVSLGLILVITIVMLNLKTYFSEYLSNLPYENTPIARYITDFFDLMPEETQLFLVGCCWEYSMPEPLSIEYEMDRPQNFHYIQASELDCGWLETALTPPAVVVWDYRSELPGEQLEDCADKFPAQLYVSPAGLPMFHAASVQGLRNLQGAADVNVQWVEWQGQLVLAHYSTLDAGRIEDALDGEFNTLMRGLNANPFVLEFEFSEPVTTSGIELTIAAIETFHIEITLTYADGSSIQFSNDYSDLPPDPTLQIDFPSSNLETAVIHIEIENLGPEPGDGFHTHVRDLSLR